MPIFTVPDNPTAFQTLVMALHVVLDDVLGKEGREAPELFFGNPFQGQADRIPRVGWQHLGGKFGPGTDVQTTYYDPNITQTQPPTIASTTPVKQVGVRRMIAQCAIFHRSPEQTEHVLDRMWLSAKRGSSDMMRFQWLLAQYEFPTESQGPRLANGESVLVLTIPIDLPVPAEYDGETAIAQLADTQLRAGLEDALNTTTPGQPEFQLSEWT